MPGNVRAPSKRRNSAGLLVLGLTILGGCGGQAFVGAGAHRMRAGDIEKTGNPQAAAYVIGPPRPADVTIHFGEQTAEELRTWTRHADGNGAPIRIVVAGMRPDTDYHLRASVRFSDADVVEDVDHVFRSGPLPLRMRDWRIHTTQFPQTPQQRGIELLNSSTGTKSQVAMADLNGRLLWNYEMPERQTAKQIVALRSREAKWDRVAAWFGQTAHRGPVRDAMGERALKEARTPVMIKVAAAAGIGFINPVKVLSNGDFLLLFCLSSQSLLSGPLPPGAYCGLREIDLTGETIRQITIAELNRKLKESGHPELRLQTFHHDVEVLPNGHWIVIANEYRPGSDPGQGQSDVFGDVLVELDTSLNPVWTWNAFDRLDINRSPMWFPDWTHSNALVYTPEDGNLLLSMRHQSWIIKIDYRNGRGSGKVLWRLGQGGDFRLINGKDPEDWQYAQHLPAIVGPRSAGVFRLTLMDNGDGRLASGGSRCVEPSSGKPGRPCYTTVPVFEIDEQAKTAAIVERKVFPVNQYSAWGGGAAPVPGGIEATLSAQGKNSLNSVVLDFSAAPGLPMLWQMEIDGNPIYRAQRLGSPYPGVQW